ncbi:hypothetical protein [Idiomarina ramblicola]|uniref:Lipoprotein n=1 Tax=Idiomarina ramblicola TaxID=263724 RepID=A0A432Z5Y9_9GAMM|nr:hypothetical protein [Idiomarina ramblicola]RUO73300.1 hypothetical protein CWI78_02310 [Idiomarina ramblicola]
MKRHVPNWTIIIITFLSLSGCFNGNNNEPSEENVKKSLMLKLPPVIKVTEMEIEVSQNIGNEVEPRVKSRFKGELELTEPLYKSVEYVMGKAVLKEITRKGTQFKVYGVSQAELKMESWDIRFEELQISPEIDGSPLSEWKSGQYVFIGSSEESALKKQYAEKMETERENKERELELAKKKKEEDRKILVAILESEKTQTGEAGNRSSTWPFRLTFKGYDSKENTFTGEMEWPTLSGVTKIEGTLIGGSLVFKEVAHINKGNVDLGTMYELKAVERGKVRGTWNQRNYNYAWFDINI